MPSPRVGPATPCQDRGYDYPPGSRRSSSGLHPPRRRRSARVAVRPPRPPRHRLLLPGRRHPGCTKQACDFRDNLTEFGDAGLDVLGVSPDPPATLAAFRDAEGLTFPLLSDPGREVLTAWGAFGEKQNYGKTVTGVIRSTFVIDADGKIEAAQYNVRATGHVAKLRKDLKV